MKPRTPILNKSSPFAKGLIGAWIMSEGSGLSVIDHSVYRNHGIINGTVPWLADSDGPKLDFTNNNANYVDVPYITPYSAGRITVACSCAYDVTLDTLRGAVTMWGNSTSTNTFLLGLGSAVDTFRFSVYIADNVIKSAESVTSFFTAGKKTFLVGTSDGSNVRLYVDGELAATTSLGTAPLLINPDVVNLRIGGRVGSSQPWDGAIDTVYMWNYAMSENDIVQLSHDPWRMFKRRGFIFSMSVGLTGKIGTAVSTSNAFDVKGISLAAGKLGTAISTTKVFELTAIQTESDIVFAFAEEHQVLKAESVERGQAFVLEVGQHNLFKRVLPANVWNDSRCEHTYKSIGECDYGRDEFAGVSELDFKIGGDGEKGVQGWRAIYINSSGVKRCEINKVHKGYLAITIDQVTDLSWRVGKTDAPFVHRVFAATDFDVEIAVDGNADENGEGEGLLVSNNFEGTSSDWVFIRRERKNNSNFVIISKTEDSLTESLIYEQISSDRVFRIVKIGIDFFFYHKASETSEWSSSIASTAHTKLNNISLKIGLCAISSSSSRTTDFTAKFDYFRLLSGGLTTCLRTLADCRAHENVRRFGGAPGIIHGPITL